MSLRGGLQPIGLVQFEPVTLTAAATAITIPGIRGDELDEIYAVARLVVEPTPTDAHLLLAPNGVTTDLDRSLASSGGAYGPNNNGQLTANMAFAGIASAYDALTALRVTVWLRITAARGPVQRSIESATLVKHGSAGEQTVYKSLLWMNSDAAELTSLAIVPSVTDALLAGSRLSGYGVRR